MINQEKGRELMRNYKGKGGYSAAVGLEQSQTYVFKLRGKEDSNE